MKAFPKVLLLMLALTSPLISMAENVADSGGGSGESSAEQADDSTGKNGSAGEEEPDCE